MKTPYLIVLLVFALGLGLLIWGSSSGTEVTLLGLTVHPRIGRAVGIISMIFSVIAFLAVWGSTQPPQTAGPRG